MNKKKGVLLVLSGIVIGCGAAVAAPVALSQAQMKRAGWGCYVADRLPDAKSFAKAVLISGEGLGGLVLA